MAMTFSVDDVKPVGEPLPTSRLGDTLGDKLAMGGDPELRVVDHGPTHPLLGAVHLAFAGHRPLELSPDAVWLTIAQGVAHHVRLNAEQLRPRLVRHAGTRTLEITWDGPMPTDALVWSEIVTRFRDLLANEIGDGRARFLECDFSTTTDVERVASRIVLMDVYAPYFDFILTCVCGIPAVTLLGTIDDWKKIRARIDVVAELGLERWVRSLAPICDHFVRAAAGEPDRAFWKRIYKPRHAYGEEIITGWIARLYPYIGSGGTLTSVNPLLELALDEPRDEGSKERWYDGPGIRSSDIPSRPSSARVTVMDEEGERSEVALDAGVLAVAQDQAGRLAPRCSWVLRRSEASISWVAERIRRAHASLPARARERDELINLSGPADFIGLYCELEEATLFEAKRPWRIRSPIEHEWIAFGASEPWSTTVVRFIDLPDGTFIGLANLLGNIFVRARADLVTSVSEDDPSFWPDRRSSQSMAEVQVLRGQLAEILTAALDASGGEPAASGTLAEAARK